MNFITNFRKKEIKLHFHSVHFQPRRTCVCSALHSSALIRNKILLEAVRKIEIQRVLISRSLFELIKMFRPIKSFRRRGASSAPTTQQWLCFSLEFIAETSGRNVITPRRQIYERIKDLIN
jgi:hypothetical protein